MSTFDFYQGLSSKTANYPVLGHPVVYPTLGLVGEAGEVAEKVKKIFRDKGGTITDMDRQSLKLELGDVLWYLTQICTVLGLSLEEVAEANLQQTSLKAQMRPKEWVHNRVKDGG